MRKPIIAGNWKMNMTPSQAKELVTALIPLVKDAACDVVVCPPYVDIALVAELVKGTNIQVGAQNIHWAEKGAFTGEISAAMLKEAGAAYAIIGHSERRQYFGETDETVNSRTKAALAAGIVPIICVGESLEQRENGETDAVVSGQVKADLEGIPGFRTYYGTWTVCGPNGFLIPVRNKDGLIQGLKIRLDDSDQPNRKYRWFSSRGLPHGTRSYSWIHVTGNVQSKRAYLTEGPLKGDAASFLMDDALFVCLGGVNATDGLIETLRELDVTEVVEAMDMDQTTNPQVRRSVQEIRRIVQTIPNIRYLKYIWNQSYKGIDDYALSRIAG